MKKLMVSGALALALSGVAMAEESGGFVGVDLGLASLTKMESDLQNTYALGNLRYGLVGGYKWFFTQSVGLRAYVSVNNGASYLQDESALPPGIQFNSLYVNANVDFLNTFYNSEQVSAGWFAGLSLGAGIHSGGVVKATTELTDNLSNISGFDLGINLGLRTLFGKHHGIEFFTRFGVVGASATAETSGVVAMMFPSGSKMSTNQIYNAGVRYTYNF
ncbi:MAG TPA: outer membrane protein [Candidatus Helicobacter avicola]|nr:outer membrane protein [Candidatus Helicobacter avicola]